MERRSRFLKGALSFVVGGAAAVGAGILMSKMCKRDSEFTEKEGVAGKAAQSSEPYCAVPEGADICYPG